MGNSEREATNNSIKFKPGRLDIPPEKPFDQDRLGREKSGVILKEFIKRLHEPFVLAINSPWGTGKTTFLRMWMKQMENDNIQCLYFNAWENDFSDTPLVSLIGEFDAGIEKLKLKGKQSKLVRKTLSKAKTLGAGLIKASIPGVVKLLSTGIIDIPEIKRLVGSAEFDQIAEEIAKKEIEKYEADRQTIHNFREQLEKLVSAVSGEDNSFQSPPFVFVIDELDRCRPTYAIELLEKIKHLFSVKGLVFVLAIDKRQLSESVKCLYGNGIDSDQYLRRFIDLEYRLPTTDIDKFVRYQFNRFGLHDILEARTKLGFGNYSYMIRGLVALFILFEFSLRTQEQIFTQISIVLLATPRDYPLYEIQLATLVCLRTANRELFLRYISGEISPMGIFEYILKLPKGREFYHSDEGCIAEAHLIRTIENKNVQMELINAVVTGSRSNTGSELEHIRFDKIRNELRRIPNHPSDGTANIDLFNKLELAQDFVP